MLHSSADANDKPLCKLFSGDIRSATSYATNAYKIRPGPSIPSSRYFTKNCPVKISKDKEKLYEENITLKQMFNTINDENLKLRTKINQLGKKIDKKSSNPGSPLLKHSHLLDNLNAAIKELRNEIQAKDKEIKDIKKHVKYTKIQELEEEARVSNNECLRLKKIIEEISTEKNIIPKGVGFSKSKKRENEEIDKILKYYKENDKIKSEKIEELLKINKELECKKKKKKRNTWKNNKSQEGIKRNQEDNQKNEENKEENEKERLYQIIESQKLSMNGMQGEIKKLQEEILKSNNILAEERVSYLEEESKHDTKSESSQSFPQNIEKCCEKIKLFLSDLKISSEKWVNSISTSNKILKSELKSAFLQDNIDINDEELDLFIKLYGENDSEILSSVLIDLFKGSEQEILTIEEAFEELKAKATYFGIKNIRNYLSISLGECEISESDIVHLFFQGILNVQNPLTLSLLIKYFLEDNISISKEHFFSKILKYFNNWAYIQAFEIEEIFNIIQELLLNCYEELSIKLQEKSRFQAFISFNEFIQELKHFGIVKNTNEECCAKAITYYYSKSIKKVPYLEVLSILYENNTNKVFTKFLAGDLTTDECLRSIHSALITDTNQSEEHLDSKEGRLIIESSDSKEEGLIIGN